MTDREKRRVDSLRTRILYYYGQTSDRAVFSLTKSRAARLLELDKTEEACFRATCRGLGNDLCVIKATASGILVALPGPQENAEALDVFNHWKRVMKRLKAKFTPQRKALVVARLREGYDAEDIKRAIDGCAGSDWHMGKNDRKRPFNSIELICRNGGKVEEFAELPIKRKPRQNGTQARLPSALAHLEGL